MTRPLPAQRRSRLKLLLIMLVFLAPMLAAGVLTFSGWQPSGKAHGVPILPQRNFAEEALPVRLESGESFAWRDQQPRLTLLALAGPGCASRCLDTLTKLAAARITLNRNAPRLRLLYLGEAPAAVSAAGVRNYWLLGTDGEGKLAEFRPATADSVSALLVESNGTALSFYPAGFDPSGLRQDLQRVIH
jgi:cytochrome oxidase Cu insertion factor (SCO1/SenC/PrrC family)